MYCRPPAGPALRHPDGYRDADLPAGDDLHEVRRAGPLLLHPRQGYRRDIHRAAEHSVGEEPAQSLRGLAGERTRRKLFVLSVAESTRFPPPFNFL